MNNDNHVSKWWSRARTATKVFLAIVLLLVIARAALPWAVKSYANKVLNSIPGYYGHIEDVDIALYRGAYRIEGLELLKTRGNAKEPFVAIRDIDIALDWRALFNGKVKTKIELTAPQLQFIQRATAETSQTSIDSSWQNKVAGLYPFDINRFLIREGLIRYKDTTKDPALDVHLDQLALTAENISNAQKSDLALPSTIDLTGRLMKSGQLKVVSKVNLLASPSEADINGSLKSLNLKELNSFARTYGGFDFEKGEFDATLELAASKTQYAGYVKTLAKKVDVVDWNKERAEGKPVSNLIWQGLVGSVISIFKNQKQDQFAARIPIESSRASVDINKWETIGSILGNAFVQALSPRIENSVEFGDALGKKGAKDEKKLKPAAITN